MLGPGGCSKYLGRKLCLAELHQTELDNRIRCAWAAFSKYSVVFRSRAYSFHLKARLFEAVVSPVALYGCAGWILTLKMEYQLRTTRRRMLRIMSCIRRHPDEPWIDFIQRTTVDVERRMAQLNFNCWIFASRRLKWRFVAKTVKTTDCRWSKRLLDWQPHFRCTPHRAVGHPRLRWEDGFVSMAGGTWLSTAASEMWQILENGFAERVL